MYVRVKINLVTVFPLGSLCFPFGNTEYFPFNGSMLEKSSNYKAIDVNKATGPDKIPNRLLKIAADVVGPSLTGIFNQSLATGIFPSDWKMAKVSPIFVSTAHTQVDAKTEKKFVNLLICNR